MSSYFKDPVQDIKNHYPNPVDQVLLLSRDGHKSAVHQLITDLAGRYTVRLQADCDSENAKGKGQDFGMDNATKVLEAFTQDVLLHQPSRIPTNDEDIRQIENLIDSISEKCTKLTMEWSYAQPVQQQDDESIEEPQLPPEIVRCQSALKVLGEILHIAAANPAIKVCDEDPKNNKNAIPSVGMCTWM